MSDIQHNIDMLYNQESKEKTRLILWGTVFFVLVGFPVSVALSFNFHILLGIWSFVFAFLHIPLLSVSYYLLRNTLTKKQLLGFQVLSLLAIQPFWYLVTLANTLELDTGLDIYSELFLLGLVYSGLLWGYTIVVTKKLRSVWLLSITILFFVISTIGFLLSFYIWGLFTHVTNF